MGMKARQISVLILAGCLFQSCGFQQDLKARPYADKGTIHNRLQANVGLLVPSPMFRKDVSTYGTHIRLYPGLYDTITRTYKGLFQSVSIVGADAVDHSYDVVIDVNCDILNNDELFVTAHISNRNQQSITLQKGNPIARTSNLQAATYFALTLTLVGAPLAFKHSNSEREQNVHNALVSILDDLKSDVYTAVDRLSRSTP